MARKAFRARRSEQRKNDGRRCTNVIVYIVVAEYCYVDVQRRKKSRR